ncbi:stalk domain-containing protein [Bacillus sp. FJAT-45350]|uniref:stalk domain-containing protein n=1 Tax=Bacillus sp. FJAT-45350 TaxID=2011014 RepID=UPI000BB98607|nr:stalk domain-containing protein [Bacillus sp. FJAT-45350]
MLAKGTKLFFLTVMLLLPCHSILAAPLPAEIHTYAGNGYLGLQDGAKLDSQFRFPSYATVDKDGNVYVSDSKNHLIRMIDSNGTVSIIAGVTSERDEYGQPVGGYEDGDIDTAMFNEPKGIAVDRNGVIYVADSKNGAIRVIENGQVSTLVTGFELPVGLVLGEDQELYISDTLRHRIIRLDANRSATIHAGGGYREVDGWLLGGLQDGTRSSAQFNEPTGLALGEDGTLYVADTGNQRIRAVTPNGTVTTVAGSSVETIDGTNYIYGGFANGLADAARFHSPHGVAVAEDGRLFVADTLNHKIRMIYEGKVSTVAGINEHGQIDADDLHASFDHPYDVVLVDNGDLLVVDYWNHSLRMIEWFKLPEELKSKDQIHVIYQGNVLEFDDVQPQIISDRTFLPIRQITEVFGYDVFWNPTHQTVTFTNDEKRISMKIGEQSITGDVDIEMDIAPFIKDERTMIPLRYVSEAFDKQVSWLSESRAVYIR